MPLRFTIRDLLWLTLVVALCVAWWIDRRHLVTSHEKFMQHLSYAFGIPSDPALAEAWVERDYQDRLKSKEDERRRGPPEIVVPDGGSMGNMKP